MNIYLDDFKYLKCVLLGGGGGGEFTLNFIR